MKYFSNYWHAVEYEIEWVVMRYKNDHWHLEQIPAFESALMVSEKCIS